MSYDTVRAQWQPLPEYTKDERRDSNEGGEICTNPNEAFIFDEWGGGEHSLTAEDSWHCLGGKREWAAALNDPGLDITEVWKAETPTHSYILIYHFTDKYELANHVVVRFPLPAN